MVHLVWAGADFLSHRNVDWSVCFLLLQLSVNHDELQLSFEAFCTCSSFSGVNNFGEGTGNGKQVCTVYVSGTLSRTLPNLFSGKGCTCLRDFFHSSGCFQRHVIQFTHISSGFLLSLGNRQAPKCGCMQVFRDYAVNPFDIHSYSKLIRRISDPRPSRATQNIKAKVVNICHVTRWNPH